MPKAAKTLTLPAVDDHILADGARHEIIDGRLLDVPPSQEPHAERNSKLAALLEAHVMASFNVAVDMLTRTDRLNEFAPDASVYPVERDPETGGRRLEQLAFEVVSTETLGHAATKAAKLVERGVRRVFAVDVEGQRVLEWSSRLGAWKNLKSGGQIEDPCLAVALPVDALAVAVKADDAVAAALLAKGNAVLRGAIHQAALEAKEQGKAEGRAEGRAEGKAEGRAEGLREAVEDLCDVLGIELTRARKAELKKADEAALEALRAHLKTHKRWPR